MKSLHLTHMILPCEISGIQSYRWENYYSNNVLNATFPLNYQRKKFRPNPKRQQIHARRSTVRQCSWIFNDIYLCFRFSQGMKVNCQKVFINISSISWQKREKRFFRKNKLFLSHLELETIEKSCQDFGGHLQVM